MAEHKMTFEVENGITKAKIDGVYMGGGKAAQVEASEEQIKDVVEDTVKANPEMTGEEPNLEGLELSGDKYVVDSGSGIEIIEMPMNSSMTVTQEQMDKLLSCKALLGINYNNVMHFILALDNVDNSYAYFVTALRIYTSDTYEIHSAQYTVQMSKSTRQLFKPTYKYTDFTCQVIPQNVSLGFGKAIKASNGSYNIDRTVVVTITYDGSTWSNSMSAQDIYTYYVNGWNIELRYSSVGNYYSAFICSALTTVPYQFELIGAKGIKWDSTLNKFIFDSSEY